MRKKRNLNLNINTKTFCICSILFLSAGILTKLYFSNKATVLSTTLSATLQKQETLLKDVGYLKQKSSELSAMADLKQKATQLGFLPMTGSISLLEVTVREKVADASVVK